MNKWLVVGVLHPCNIYGHISTDLWQCTVMSWSLCSAALLGNQTAGSMTWYSTQYYYADTDLTSPWHVLLMLNATLGSNKYSISHGFDSTGNRTVDLPHARPALYPFGYRTRWAQDRRHGKASDSWSQHKQCATNMAETTVHYPCRGSSFDHVILKKWQVIG